MPDVMLKVSFDGEHATVRETAFIEALDNGHFKVVTVEKGGRIITTVQPNWITAVDKMVKIVNSLKAVVR